MSMNRNMALELVRATEAAALASARLMGRGDETEADQVAVDAMRTALNRIEMDATVVIGEGERDKAPMLYIGERVGKAAADGSDGLPTIDIAVDPLEGTNLCATGTPNAIAVLAVSERGGLLHAPDIYMDKLVVGPRSKHAVDLDGSTDDLSSDLIQLHLRVLCDLSGEYKTIPNTAPGGCSYETRP